MDESILTNPPPAMILTLIGYRGSGKSTVAAPLAARLGWECVDADREIERRAGTSIRTIFDDAGESEFRRIEREVMADLLAGNEVVVSAGGGAVLDKGTRRDMRAAGPVVWLTASAATLWRRISGDADTAEQRPDLTDAGGLAEVEQLIAQRAPLYRECARLVIETDRDSAATIVDHILAELGDELTGGHRPS